MAAVPEALFNVVPEVVFKGVPVTLKENVLQIGDLKVKLKDARE